MNKIKIKDIRKYNIKKMNATLNEGTSNEDRKINTQTLPENKQLYIYFNKR